jgi:effector-binding domain-containing protein
MAVPVILHKELASVQIASRKLVIETRADLPPVFEVLRRACGEAACGPEMVILYYGAVKDGLLVEAAVPVSRPVESGEVHTRTLETRKAWTLVQRGPHETLPEARRKIFEYIAAHAGTPGGGVREVHLQVDPADPGKNITEVQVLDHEWEQRLAGGVESVLGADARRQVTAGLESLTSESPAEDYREWVRLAMQRLDALTDDPQKKYQVVSCAAHVFPQQRIDRLRGIYEQRGEIDDVLREMYKDPDWYEDPVRKGNQLHMRKVPFDPEAYRKAATPAERRQAYCHCAFVRPYLDQVPARMPATFCWCGAGWYRRLWEGVLGEPIRVEHVETLIKGNDYCTLVITLPIQAEGELSTEMVRT